MNHKISVAPMLDWTNRHCRYLHRLISPDTVLYTEMVTTSAILRGDTKKHIGYNEQEHPVVLQLGGSDVEDLAKCCEIADEYGYDAVNLNVGCPSDRVQKGRFGACLMNEPRLVAECVAAMQVKTDLPITVKCRIGVDDNDSLENFLTFVQCIVDAGVKTVIVHARKAWLKGLSPKQNRTIPPLHYDYVYAAKLQFPDIEFILNGGINTVEDVAQQLTQVDGVMLGRAIWNSPWLLYQLQQRFYESDFSTTRDEVLAAYVRYCETQIQTGLKMHWMLPPILGLFHGLPGNKKWKSYLVAQAPKRGDDLRVFSEARSMVDVSMTAAITS